MTNKKKNFFEFESMTIFFSKVSIVSNLFFAAIKIIFAFIVTNYFILISGVFNVLIFIATLICLKGIKEHNNKFKTRNLLVAIIVFLAGIMYILYSLRLIIYNNYIPYNFPIFMTIVIVPISFIEVILAIIGLINVKNHDHFYRNIKMVKFVTSLTAIVLAMGALLTIHSDINQTKIYIGIFGLVVGAITWLMSLLILFIPKYSIYDREHNVFVIEDLEKSKIYFSYTNILEIPLSESVIFKRYVYRAYLKEDIVDGHIEIIGGLFSKIDISLKILIIIFYPIIFIPHLFFYILYVTRTFNIPKRLEQIMKKNGFKKIDNNKN